MRESDLYLPIKNFFTELGYLVKAEVKDADVTAIKDDEVVIIEMKTSLNVKLLYQACQRQRLTDYVYVAIPKPSYKVYRSKSFKEKLYLLKRLHLGLLLVSDTVKVELDPKPFSVQASQRVSKKKKQIHLKEFQNRMGDSNIGGVTKTKIMTAYKEQTILIASELYEPKSIKELKAIHGFQKTSSILQKNFYNWFERVERGVYQLSEKGRKDLLQYETFINEMKNQ